MRFYYLMNFNCNLIEIYITVGIAFQSVSIIFYGRIGDKRYGERQDEYTGL